ncbi:MAG TPA: hypothetical protein PKM27_00180 [Saprospiraceae bacterium]|nr:hypothetical protein [Saprospiraceae bacterium]HNT19086.1 hypothetical protein [Saprospiraceae bacterium]
MIRFGLLFISILVLGSCAQISTFQTARTTPKNEGEIGLSLGIAGISESFGTDESFALPNLEFWGRYGLGQKTDLGIKISTGLSGVIDVKQQLVGDQTSKFALAVGPGLGIQGIVLDEVLFQAHLPVHLSYHPGERTAWYLTPRYVYQGVVGEGGLNYLGTSLGVLFGRNIKFGLEYSFSKILDPVNDIPDEFDDEDFGANLYNIGFGVKFPIR